VRLIVQREIAISGSQEWSESESCKAPKPQTLVLRPKDHFRYKNLLRKYGSCVVCRHVYKLFVFFFCIPASASPRKPCHELRIPAVKRGIEQRLWGDPFRPVTRRGPECHHAKQSDTEWWGYEFCPGKWPGPARMMPTLPDVVVFLATFIPVVWLPWLILRESGFRLDVATRELLSSFLNPKVVYFQTIFSPRGLKLPTFPSSNLYLFPNSAPQPCNLHPPQNPPPHPPPPTHPHDFFPPLPPPPVVEAAPWAGPGIGCGSTTWRTGL